MIVGEHRKLDTEYSPTYSMEAIFHGAPHLKVLLTEMVMSTLKPHQRPYNSAFTAVVNTVQGVYKAASLHESVTDIRIPVAFVKG